MILSDDEIMVINQTAEFDSAIGYARAIEAKVLEKLSDKLRDAERYEWLRNNSYDREGFAQLHVWKHTWEPHSKTKEPIEWKNRVRGSAIDQVIDAVIKELK